MIFNIFLTKIKQTYCEYGYNKKKNFKLNFVKEKKFLNLYINLWSKQKHYKFYRIQGKLPLNGQRTHTNAQTAKKTNMMN